MLSIPVTLTVAAGAALISVWLMIRIAQVRRQEKIWIGDGGNDALLRRMRAQANFVESAPFVLFLILAIELAAGTSFWLWLAGALYLVGRVFHPFGMDGMRAGRMIGAVLTLAALVGLALWGALLAYRGGAAVPGPGIDLVPPAA